MGLRTLACTTSILRPVGMQALTTRCSSVPGPPVGRRGQARPRLARRPRAAAQEPHDTNPAKDLEEEQKGWKDALLGLSVAASLVSNLCFRFQTAADARA